MVEKYAMSVISHQAMIAQVLVSDEPGKGFDESVKPHFSLNYM